MWDPTTFLVSQAPSFQGSPKMATNNARSLAAWVESTTGGARVYATRINPLGEFEDVVAFQVGRESLSASIIGVYTTGSDFLVAWHGREVRTSGSGASSAIWIPMVARVSRAGVVSSQFDCGSSGYSPDPVDFWVDRSGATPGYGVASVDGRTIYRASVGSTLCASRFLYEDDVVTGATRLVATASAVYFITRTGDLHRVNQTTAVGGGSGAPLDVGASDLLTLDVLPGLSDTIAYSNSTPRFPVSERVGVVRVSSTGDIEWHVPDLADPIATRSNPQLTRGGDQTFVVWRQTENSIVGQRLGPMGERMDPLPATIDAEPTSRYLGDIGSDLSGRSTLVYSAVLPEQGWATRLRARTIDFRFDTGSALGATCTTGFDCGSGICADGVCCNEVCGYSNPNDCQACSAATGAAADGTCSTRATGTECRASAGECDVAEVCDGTLTVCPANVLAPADSACGSDAEGPCDLADRCNGASASCELRGFATSGTSCRTSRGGCDAEDSCDGAQAACSETFLAAGVVCRAPDGACDVAEACDGATDVCPTDVVELAGVECRAAAGDCDVAETCDGSSNACPTNSVLASTQVCRAATGPCDSEESCDGIAPTCPRNSFLGSTTECRPAVGECDAPEFCSGMSAICAGDASAEDGSMCGGDALACESATCRDGACVTSPVVCEAGAVCSEATGACAPVEPAPAMGCQCQAGPGASQFPGAIVALLGLALLRRRSTVATR